MNSPARVVELSPVEAPPPELIAGAAPPTKEIESKPVWRAALDRLLSAVGRDIGYVPAETLPELAEALLGTGIELIPVAVVDGQALTTEGALGSIVRVGQHWQARLGSPDTGEVLEDGILDEVALAALEPMREAWVLRDRRRPLRALLPFMARHRRELVGLFVAAIIVNALGLTLPLFSSFVYDKVLGNGILETLWALAIGLAIITGIDFFVRMLRTAVAERFGVTSEVDVDQAVFQNLLRTPANQMPGMGPLLEKYKQVLSYRDMLSSSLLIALADIPFLFLFLVAIALEAGPLVCVSLLCGGIMVLCTLACHAPITAYEHESRMAGERRFALLADVLGSRDAVIGHSFRAALAQRWRGASVSAATAASRSRYWRSLAAATSSSTSYLSFVGVLVGGVYMVEARTLTSGGLLAASMLTSRVMGMFGSAVTLHLRWREFQIAMGELDTTVPGTNGQRSSHSYGRLHGQVRLEHVTCQLRPQGRPVLQDISFSVSAGEIVGLAGAPGGGKTTLLRLLSGVIKPESGNVLIDDIPLSELSEQDVSGNIGFKPQEFALFEGTIADNVLMGRTALSADARRELLKTSGLASAFDRGALNWHTAVGARGSQLSGGQRQLVALARALAGSPCLLLLDEPNNGLDAPLEAQLAQQLMALRGKATIFVSTHSRTLLEVCDRIMVVGEGRLLANGPREKILM